MRGKLSWVLVAILAAMPGALAESVVISQVLYDPLAESGSEAVELYNPTAMAVNISGWVIITETSAADATIPAGTALQPYHSYLIADAGWVTLRDNLSWPLADHEEALTLANADAGIAVSNATHLVDAVGWGTASGIAAGLFEGMPHSGTGEGFALLRNGGDTGDNSNDFTAATPDFRNSSQGDRQQSSGAEITLSVMVSGAVPVLGGITIPDEDLFSDGIQVFPVPKGNKSVVLSVVVADANGNGDIASVMARVKNKTYALQKVADVNATAAQYTAAISMSYTDGAGNYSVAVNATDNAGFSASATAAFWYQGLLAFEVDTASITFNALPGETAEIGGDDNLSTANATLWNTGNTPLNLQLRATNLSSGSAFISLENAQFNIGGGYEALPAAMTLKSIGLQPDGKQPLAFRISIPLSTRPGNYTGSIYLDAVAS